VVGEIDKALGFIILETDKGKCIMCLRSNVWVYH